MGIVSLIIGIVVFLTALFPHLGYMVIIAAAVGLILGICRLANENNSCHAISGVVLNGLAIVLALYWSAIISFADVEIFNHILIP